MFLEFLFGILFGIIAGLIPSVHINFIAAIVPSNSPYFLIPLAIIFSYLNTIPAILLQYADDYTITLKTQASEWLKQGRAMEAIDLTILGSFYASIISINVVFLLDFVPLDAIKYFSVAVLATIIIYFLKIDFLISLLYGFLGFFSFNFKQGLFHIFSLGIATYNFFHFSKSKIPEQKIIYGKIKLKELIALIFVSLLSIIFLFYPGITSSLAIVPLMYLFRNQKNERLYFLFIGALNSASYVFAPFLLKFNIARNFLVQRLKFTSTLEFYLVTIIAVIVSFILARKIMLYSIKFISKLNLPFFNTIIFIFTLILSFYYDNIFGILIGFCSYFLIYLLNFKNKPRYLILASIAIPVFMKKVLK
ncbi:MAG: tripartite tricarboxylate transporter permease [Candidatus Woesearchaeota archaeon]